jgi:glycosyltransferase involved in cell wall biosynthesis
VHNYVTQIKMDMMIPIPVKVGLQQRVLPDYRARFFDHLAAYCRGGLGVFAGESRRTEAIQLADSLDVARFFKARNLHLLGGPAYLCFQRGLNRWLHEWDPDVLVLEANPRYLANREAIRWMHKRNRPVIGWGLGATYSEGILGGMRNRVRRQYLSSFDALIAYSSQGAEQYAVAGVLPERIHVAINSATSPPTSIPKREPINGRVPRILFVGRLQARKRVDLLLKACALIENQVECWIIGDGPEDVRLKELAQRVYPEAKFLGPKHGPELEHFFEQADLFVLPGTGGLAVQEAMAHALPVIVAEGDGTQRDLVNNENGWLLESGNLDDLYRAMREALENPQDLLRRGLASYQIVLDRANIDAMAKVFLEVINYLHGSQA